MRKIHTLSYIPWVEEGQRLRARRDCPQQRGAGPARRDVCESQSSVSCRASLGAGARGGVAGIRVMEVKISLRSHSRTR